MKTAISLPNDLFAKAEALARKKGVSRSELYATAIQDYLRRHERSSLTDQINRAIDELGEDAFRLDSAIAAYAARRLAKEEW